MGYHRYGTATGLLLLNEIWRLHSMLGNHFHPQQKLITKVRTGAKVAKKHDQATTPYRRVLASDTITDDRKVALTRMHVLINPAATQRRIQQLSDQLLTLTEHKTKSKRARTSKRASPDEATKPPTRAS